ncbi:MAG TPA: hypothetical protein VNK82_02780 [Terriglobales bacterium]|nr:hypothetical protein [Terriglobales bacterium]
MRTLLISGTVAVTILWALAVGVVCGYAAVLAVFRVLMPTQQPPQSPRPAALKKMVQAPSGGRT